MGHERIGTLPKTQQWRTVVNQLSSFSGDNNNVNEIAQQTLKNVRLKLDNVEHDAGVKSAFQFLVLLSVAAKQKNPTEYLAEKGVNLSNKATPLQIAKAVNDWVAKNIQSNEYASIAKSSAIDAISSWFTQNEIRQASLFQDSYDSFDVLKNASDGAGFCELSRLYFSKFTERYLKYFLEREASAQSSSIDNRNKFSKDLHEHVKDISLHAFETAKITQSFAAGWFNKYAKENIPADSKVKSFLVLAFGKLRDELLREESK